MAFTGVAAVSSSAQVVARTMATMAVESRVRPGARVLGCKRPLVPSSPFRCCQRDTAGRLTLARRATSRTGSRSAEKRTICTRCARVAVGGGGAQTFGQNRATTVGH